MRRVVAQARKELTQICRDWRTLALALVLPLVLLLLMSVSLSLTVNNLPVIVQDFDDSPASRDFVDAIRASITLHVVAWPIDRRPEEALSSNTARAVLIIPPHFGRDMALGANSPVQLLVDASDANTAKLTAGYANEITRAYNQRIAGTQGLALVQTAIRLWYNPGLSAKKFYGPGIFVLGLSMFPPLLAALAMAKEGELKTILQVYVSSISAHEFLLGKILAFMVVALAECVVMLVLLFTYFGLGLAGDPTPVHRRHDSLHVLRGGLWNHGGSDDSEPGRRDASGGPRRLPPGVSAFRPDFSHRKHPCGIALDLEFHVGPVLHRSRAGCAPPRWWLARRLVEGHDHRHHRLGFLWGWLVQHAPNAAQSVSE